MLEPVDAPLGAEELEVQRRRYICNALILFGASLLTLVGIVVGGRFGMAQQDGAGDWEEVMDGALGGVGVSCVANFLLLFIIDALSRCLALEAQSQRITAMDYLRVLLASTFTASAGLIPFYLSATDSTDSESATVPEQFWRTSIGGGGAAMFLRQIMYLFLWLPVLLASQQIPSRQNASLTNNQV